MISSNKATKRKNKTFEPHTKKTGLPPGTLIYTGSKKESPVSITVISYNDTEFSEATYTKDENYISEIPNNKTVWININGLHDVDVVEKIGSTFKLHPLILEDILNVYQLPKIDEYQENDLVFITVNEFYIDDVGTIDRDQISLVLGENYVITFQEEEGDYFEMIRDRLRNAKGRIRTRKADYLCYALIDAIADSYFLILDNFSKQLEEIENEIFENENKNQLTSIHFLNKNLIQLRRSVGPLKEVIYHMMKEDCILIESSSKIFLRDLMDHVNQVISQIDADREFLSDLINTNMTHLNSRLNEVIKVLTLISTIFIPLTFIVGVYGMNFDFLPELHWHYGYLFIWILMIVIVAVQVYIFKKNKWL